MALLPPAPPIELLVPGGIQPTDHLHVGTNDGTCSRCRKPIGDDEGPLLLWRRSGHDMYAFCERCCGVSAEARAMRRWGLDR